MLLGGDEDAPSSSGIANPPSTIWDRNTDQANNEKMVILRLLPVKTFCIFCLT